MSRPNYERRDPPWQSMAKDNSHMIQIAFNDSGLPFWRTKKWFQTDKAWTQWSPLRQGGYRRRGLRNGVQTFECAVMNSWQPIETAPAKTEVLTWVPPLGYVIASRERGKWREAWDKQELFTTPTHWMPLPKEPAV